MDDARTRDVPHDKGPEATLKLTEPRVRFSNDVTSGTVGLNVTLNYYKVGRTVFFRVNYE